MKIENKIKLDLDVYTQKFSRGKNKNEFIVLHHTADYNMPFKSMVNYMSKNPRQVSVHYVIWRKGEIGRIWLDSYILWHAGLWSIKGQYRNVMNRYSIWIEIQNNGVGEIFSKEQIISVVKLTNFLTTNYNIKIDKLIRHKDYAPKRKTDVADNLWNLIYKNFNSFKRVIINEGKLFKDNDEIENVLYWKKEITKKKTNKKQVTEYLNAIEKNIIKIKETLYL